MVCLALWLVLSRVGHIALPLHKRVEREKRI